MPATPARIAFVTQQFRKVIAGPDATVEAAFGDLARETESDKPVETFFDDTDDAQAMADERLTIMKADRARFEIELAGTAGLTFVRTLDYSQATPCGTVIDTGRTVNRSACVAQIQMDLRGGRGGLLMWG